LETGRLGGKRRRAERVEGIGRGTLRGVNRRGGSRRKRTRMEWPQRGTMSYAGRVYTRLLLQRARFRRWVGSIRRRISVRRGRN
jgi:hypothetical protein